MNVREFSPEPYVYKIASEAKKEDLISRLEQEAEYLRQRLEGDIVFTQKERQRLQDELQQIENDLKILNQLEAKKAAKNLL